MQLTRMAIFGLLAVFCAVAMPALAQLPVANTEVVEEHWPNGQLKLRKEVLRLEDGSYVDHGSFERWHSNGNKEYEAFFVRGKKEGTTIRYHKNGRKATEQHYRNGRKDGRCRSWDNEGILVKEENWENGRPHGTWTIWEKGKVKWSHTYDHGKP